MDAGEMRLGTPTIKADIENKSITFEVFKGNNKIQVLRIGSITTYGAIYSDYEVISKIVAKNKNEYNLYLAENDFGNQIQLVYNKETFTLSYNKDLICDDARGFWRNYYTGYFELKQ